MRERLLEISGRIRELREILGRSPADIAASVGIPQETYLQYEAGTLDIPISVLYLVADRLGTDMTVLLTGESPRMDTHTVVRAGHGIDVERFPGYRYMSLAFNFINREMEPLLVSLDPDDAPAALVMHGGQEFNYVLEGTVRVTLGKKAYDLSAGDSVYFNPALPHGQQAVGGTARFLTVITKDK
jgi:mannose-6-phosphate isomerase-like protein (cupin superfamily)/DNA-binding XRE family transcriptional regulator